MYTHTYIDMCVYVHMWPAVELTALVLLDSGGGVIIAQGLLRERRGF